jgi:DNA replication protein DnaC
MILMYNQTANKLRDMQLAAMAAEYLRQGETPGMDALDFDERIGMMVDAEWLSRENKKVYRLMKEANLRFPTACFGDIDYRPVRKLNRAYIARLTSFEWAKESINLFLTGSTGTGKTWLACAFGAEACHRGLNVRFYRVNRLLGEMAIAIAAGTITKLLTKIKKTDILILDDWGLMPINPAEGRFLLELFDDRYKEKSTIISAQLPVSKWHEMFEDATLADAVLDRIVHNSHRLELEGASLRPINQQSSLDNAPCGGKNQDT